VLKRIRDDVLAAFLDPYREYLESRGLRLDGDESGSADGSPIDRELLAQILATPDCDTPVDLIDTLEVCEAVCFDAAVDELIARDRERPRPILRCDHSNEDIVLLTWKHDPEAVERIFNRAAMELDRSLCVYRANAPLQTQAFSKASLQRLQKTLGPAFESQLRGPTCRITAHERSNGCHALVIRHGDPIHKTGAIAENGEAESIVFRPERIDLAFHDSARNEWRISGLGGWLQQLYARCFASVLHEFGCWLRRSVSYSLAPLIEEGLSILQHRTRQVVEVRAVDLQVRLGGVTVALTGRDIGEAFTTLGQPLIESGEIRSVRLAFILSNRRRALNVTIHQGRLAVKGDIDHPAIEAWLIDTGFLTTETSDEPGLLASH
jgi:hypothetical protein